MPRTAAQQKALRLEMLQTLRSRLGFDSFRENQEKAVVAALEGYGAPHLSLPDRSPGRDTLVLANTGAGKSLCFVLPALMGRGPVLVVSPLIALMQDQVAGLRAKGIRAEHLASSRAAGERKAVLESLGTADGPEVLYITPESLATAAFQEHLGKLGADRRVALIAVDEAHCISSWGHDFRPAYRRLASLTKLMPNVPVMALTATATRKVQKDIVESLLLRDPMVLKTSFNRPNIHYSVKYTEQGDVEMISELATTLKQLNPNPESTNAAPCAIVYARKRETTERIAQQLTDKGLGCKAYHAGMKAEKREEVLVDWASGRTPIVAATIAFGMGIDKPDVRAVVHFTLPKSLEGFYQVLTTCFPADMPSAEGILTQPQTLTAHPVPKESGRAGRDGLPSSSIMFFNTQDASLVRWIIDKESGRKGRKRKLGAEGESSGGSQSAALQSFNAVESFATERRCRRVQLMAHFGEDWTPAPGSRTCCDWCGDPEGVSSSLAAATRRTRTPHRETSTSDLGDGRAVRGYEMEFESGGFDADGQATEQHLGRASGSAWSPPKRSTDLGSSVAKGALRQAKSCGADVFEALERAEKLYDVQLSSSGGCRPAGGSSRVLSRLNSTGGAASLPLIGTATDVSISTSKKAKGFQIAEITRHHARTQIASSMQRNTALSGERNGELEIVAAKMEKEAYDSSSSKSVYLSKVNTAKRVAGYAGSLSELGGKSSLPSPDNVAKGSKELPRSSADPNAGAAGFAPAQGTAFPKGQEIPKYVSVETLRQVFEACQGLVSQANAELDGRNAGSHAAEESACAVLASEFAAAENLEALSHWVVSTDVIGQAKVVDQLKAWRANKDGSPTIAAAANQLYRTWKQQHKAGKRLEGNTRR